MKKRFKWSLCFCMAFLLLYGAAASSQELSLIKIVNRADIDDLPLYVAIEEGYFAEQGVKVEMIRLSGTPNVLSAAMRGDIHGGPMSPADAFLLAEKKVPIKIVTWLGHAHPGTKCGVHVAAQSNIHKLSDLKGKRIGVSTSINSKIFLTEIARKGGLKEKDVRILWGGRPDNPMQHEAALRSGGIDGFVV